MKSEDALGISRRRICCLTLGSKQLMPSTRLNVLMGMERFSRCSNAWGLAMARLALDKM